MHTEYAKHRATKRAGALAGRPVGGGVTRCGHPDQVLVPEDRCRFDVEVEQRRSPRSNAFGSDDGAVADDEVRRDAVPAGIGSGDQRRVVGVRRGRHDGTAARRCEATAFGQLHEVGRDALRDVPMGQTVEDQQHCAHDWAHR